MILNKCNLKERTFTFETEVTMKISKTKSKIYEVGVSYAGRTIEEGKKFPRTSEFLYKKVDAIEEIKQLAGIYQPVEEGDGSMGSNISKTANQISSIMKEKNIQPGTPEWFQLWFSKPYLTGEKPYGE